MNFDIRLQPLNDGVMDAYRTLAHDRAAQAAAGGAANAVRRLMAAVSPANLLAHAASEPAPVDWLQGVELAAQAALDGFNAAKADTTAVLQADALHRHRCDSAALVLTGQLQNAIANHRRVIVAAQKHDAVIREALRRESLTPHDFAQRTARQSLGVNEWAERQIREAIVDGEARLTNINAVLSASARSGEAMSPAVHQEMTALRERVSIEVSALRLKLERQAAEMVQLEALATELGLRADGGPELLIQAIGKAERDSAVAASLIVEAEAALQALDGFLSDPLRALGVLPAEIRGQLMELTQATAGGLRTQVPRLWAK